MNSDPELLELLKEYDYYIDGYVDFPKFTLFYLEDNSLKELFINVGEIILDFDKLDEFFKEEGFKNYIFVYSVKYENYDKRTILFRFAKLSIEYELPKYQQKKKMIVRDEKINRILND